MNNTPFIVLNKSTNNTKKRKLSESRDSSDSEQYSSCESSPTIQIPWKIKSEGGFTEISNTNVFVFPTKTTTPEQRLEYTKEFVAQLYSVGSNQKENKSMRF